MRAETFDEGNQVFCWSKILMRVFSVNNCWVGVKYLVGQVFIKVFCNCWVGVKCLFGQK